MGNKSGGSIFDPEFQRSAPKKKKEATPPPKPKSKPLPPEQQEKLRKQLIKDPELSAWLEQISLKKEELKTKLAELIDIKGFTPNSIKKYLSNASNFTPDAWKEIQDRRAEIKKSLGSNFELTLVEGERKKQKKEMDHNRKGKTLGARKNWMPMK